LSRTSHHRAQKANQCKDLWGKRGDMGTGSHYSKYNRTLAGRKERRLSAEEINIQQIEDKSDAGFYGKSLELEISKDLSIHAGSVKVEWWAPGGEYIVYIDGKFSGHYPDYFDSSINRHLSSS